MAEKGPRSYVKDFTIRVGPFAVVGKLVSLARKGKESSSNTGFNMVSPNGKPVKQVYREEGTDLIFEHDQLGRARSGVVVDVEAIKEAKKSDLPANTINLSVHSASEVAASAWASGNAYIFIPHNADDYYGAMYNVLSDSKRAFMGLCNLKTHEGLFRLRIWNNSIIVEKMLNPEDVTTLEMPKVSVDKTLIEMAKQMLDKLQTPYDPEKFTSTTRQRLAALVPAEAVAPKPDKKVAVADKVNLMAELAAFLTDESVAV